MSEIMLIQIPITETQLLGEVALLALVFAVWIWVPRPLLRGAFVKSASGLWEPMLLSHSRRSDEITQRLPVVSADQTADDNTTPTVSGTRSAARTDSGRRREINEDDTLVAELEDQDGRIICGLYIVADGMGGHDKGEIASSTAVQAAMNAAESHSFFTDGHYLDPDIRDEEVLDLLRTIVSEANKAVYGKRLEEKSDMGTTMVLALTLKDKAYIANVGDSRAYILRDGYIRQITEDHSLVERMVASGQITEAEARLHPQRNMIFRWLGIDLQVEVDLFVEKLRPEDRLLLCSDGLNSMIPDSAIGHLAYHQENLDYACRLLIRAANEAGGRDNISTVLVEMLP